ncbi:hypothetical protein V8F20_007818 [Naviculisporaceae sp. PSN 640]
MESAPSLDYALQNHNDHHHLGTRINIATRSAHTKLNKDLLLRIPLALPPVSPTPSVYVSGLIHVAPIYLAFESLWRDIVASEPKGDDEEGGSSGDVSPGNGDQKPGEYDGPPRVSGRIHSTLKFLHLPVLQRSARLRADILSITGWTEDVVDEQILQASKRGNVGEFVSHIERSVERHPHVLLAYAWVLYMALFAGGRFIRGSLESAGAEFWGATCEAVYPSLVPGEQPTPPSPVFPTMSPGGYEGDDECPGSSAAKEKSTTTTTATAPAPPCPRSSIPLQFFRFATPQDGEDLKVEFKRRLIDSESRLTTKELENIVEEATRIFGYMNLLVGQLDCVFAKSPFAANGGCVISSRTGSPCFVSSISSSLESWARLLIPGGGRGPRSHLKDSVAIARERGVRASFKGERSSAGSFSSVTSSEWGRDRDWSYSPGSGTSSVSGVSNLQAKGTLTPAAELIEKAEIPCSSEKVSSTQPCPGQPEQQDKGNCPESGTGPGVASEGRLERSKSVRFGKDVASPSKRPAGLARSRSSGKKRPSNPIDDTSHGEHETSSSAGGLDGVDEYESDLEERGVCPVAGVAKCEKHVRFLMTPAQEEDERRRKAAAASSSTGSTGTVTVLKNGLVVLGLVGVVLGVGRFRV